MSVEAEGGAQAGRLGVMGRLQGQVSTALREGSVEARAYCERIIARLDQIYGVLCEIRGEEDERVTYTKAVAAGATEQLDAGRPGFSRVIKRVAITADGATDVDLFVGSASDVGFRHRETFAAVGRASRDVTIEVPEGAPIFAVAGAAGARVNIGTIRQHT